METSLAESFDQGRIAANDSARLVTDQYIQMNSRTNGNLSSADLSNSKVIRSHGRCEDLEIHAVSIRGGNELDIHTGGEFIVCIQYKSNRQPISPAFVVSVNDNLGLEVVRLSTMPISGYPIQKLNESGIIELTIKSLPLVAGSYSLDVGFVRESVEWLLRLDNVLSFQVAPSDYYKSGFALDRDRGMIVVDHSWNHRLA